MATILKGAVQRKLFTHEPYLLHWVDLCRGIQTKYDVLLSGSLHCFIGMNCKIRGFHRLRNSYRYCCLEPPILQATYLRVAGDTREDCGTLLMLQLLGRIA